MFLSYITTCILINQEEQSNYFEIKSQQICSLTFYLLFNLRLASKKMEQIDSPFILKNDNLLKTLSLSLTMKV